MLSVPDSPPLATANAQLLECLGAAGVPVRSAQASHDLANAEELTGLIVWPLTLVPEAPSTQGGGRLRMRLRHLVCAGGPAPVALQTLDLLLEKEQPYLVPEEVPASLWQALTVPPRIGLFFDVPVQFIRPERTVPRVTSLPRLITTSLCAVTGKVIAPGGAPLAGMSVAVADGTAATYTDTRGCFILPGVVADQPIRLVIAGRGLRLEAEVAADAGEPIVITCEI